MWKVVNVICKQNKTFDKHPEKVGERCVSEKDSQDAVECRYTGPGAGVFIKHEILKGDNLSDFKVIYGNMRYQKFISDEI